MPKYTRNCQGGCGTVMVYDSDGKTFHINLPAGGTMCAACRKWQQNPVKGGNG
jgi:hypothetical protein